MTKPVTVFIALVGLTIINQNLGIRVTAVLEIIWAVKVIKRRSVSFGIEGHEKHHHLSGGIAIVIGFIALVLGMVLFIWPSLVDSLATRY